MNRLPATARLGRSTIGVLAVVVVAAPPAMAQSSDWYDLSSRRQADGVDRLIVDVEYGVGRLRMAPADDDLLYDLSLRYDARRFSPVRDWELEDGQGRLHVRLVGDDQSVELDELEDIDDDDFGSLSVGLSRVVPTSLTLGVLAAEVDLELGGAAVDALDVRTAASETHIRFGEVNAVRMGRMELVAGAAEFTAENLGNARFDEFEFSGAVGDVTLDFRGSWDGSARGNIRMGLGELSLVFPRGLGVRIEKRGFLAAFDSSGFERVEGGFQTPGFESATSRLTLVIRAAFGDVDVRFTD